MITLPQIRNRLRDEFDELCKACFAEHEWLEEGHAFDPDKAQHDQADHEAAVTTGAKSVGP